MSFAAIMSSVETRPERAYYNVGVALRLVEGVLDDLHRDLAPLRPRAADRIVGHVMTALSLVAQLDAPAGGGSASGADRVRTELRGELETLLVDLRSEAVAAPVG